MEPVAFGFLATIVGTVVFAVVADALIGAVVWKLRFSFAWGCLGAGIYLVVTPPFVDFAFLAFGRLSAPPLIMTLLTSYLTARYVRVLHHVRAVWATIAALGCASILGAFYLFLFTHLFMTSFWKPILMAVGADACLLVLAIRSRHLVPQ
jgi:hypothetical protein